MESQDLQNVWKSCLEIIRVNVSPAIFGTWFTETHLSSLTKNNDRYLVEVGCKSTFIKGTIEMRYFGMVQDSLSKVLESPCDLIFSVKQNPNSKTSVSEVSPLFQHTINDPESFKLALQKSNLRPYFSFENFAVSSSNQMAWAAADAVSKNPGVFYNPLFIWGGVGVGKTHLMSAVGHYLLSLDNSQNIYACTGEQFTNDIVEGIRNKSTQNVRSKYRKLKALFVDDIQFIAGKDTVQEEFFHTFNALAAVGSQIILTSDKPPSEIPKIEERLKSRFEAGLIVDIGKPDFELRCAITQIKTKEKGLDIPMDLIQLIAGNADSPRKIEGVLVKILSEIKLKNAVLSLELVEKALERSSDPNGTPITRSPDEVIEATCKYYSISKRVILSAGRSRSIARPRQILMYLLRIQMQLPLEEVGRLIGGRDHTTVMHAVDKITQLASTDVNIREGISGIKSLL
jgi:chromosomal replication initiator protein